jgi:hypothetical protein
MSETSPDSALQTPSRRWLKEHRSIVGEECVWEGTKLANELADASLRDVLRLPAPTQSRKVLATMEKALCTVVVYRHSNLLNHLNPWNLGLGNFPMMRVTTIAAVAMLAVETSAALLTPVTPAAPEVVNQALIQRANHAPAWAAPDALSDRSCIFPSSSTLLAEEISPAKAKIEAAKAAQAAKLAARGLSAPETKELSLALDFNKNDSEDPFAEANELREKRYALEDKTGSKRSKSQSAQIEQLKIMEKKARAKANADIARAAEREAAKQAEKDAPASFNKISPIKLPFLD